MNTRDITSEILGANNIDFSDNELAMLYKKNARIIAMEDEDYSYKDLAGDVYNPAANPDICPNVLKRQENSFKSRIKRSKVWGIGLAIGGMPIYNTFVWGFVGNDFLGSGCDVEILAELKEIAKC